MSQTRDLIEAHRQAIQRFRSLDHLAGASLLSDPVYAVADAASDREREAERDAWISVRCCVPENATDLAALAIHFGQVIGEFDSDVDRNGETFEAFEALREACLGLAGRGMLP